jgi:hypothetical protein
VGTEDESMTKRNPTRKRKRAQVRKPIRQALPLTERIRIRHWGRHESLKEIAKALRIPIGKVERAVKPPKPKKSKKPKKGTRREVRGAGGGGVDARKNPEHVRAALEGWKTRRFHTARHDPSIVHLHGLNRDQWHVLNTLMRNNTAEWKKFKRAGILNGRSLMQIRNDWFSPGAH